MSFSVSNSFNLSESIGHYWIIKLFQLRNLLHVKHVPDQPPNTIVFNVSEVSYINRLFENVFGACPRERKIMLSGRQNYTNHVPTACRLIRWCQMRLL